MPTPGENPNTPANAPKVEPTGPAEVSTRLDTLEQRVAPTVVKPVEEAQNARMGLVGAIASLAELGKAAGVFAKEVGEPMNEFFGKVKEEGVKQTPDLVPAKTPDSKNPDVKRMELKELMDPSAPVFSFPKEFPAGHTLTTRISDVPRNRTHNPKTGKPYAKQPHPHNGVDISGLPVGTPIVVTSSATVIESGFGGGSGNYVKIKLSDGKTATFMHLSQKGAPKGATLKPGDVLGLVGNTGGSTGPHLHYEVRDEKGAAIKNPAEYMPPSLRSAFDAKRKKLGLA